MTYQEWVQRNPQAAEELLRVTEATKSTQPDSDTSESRAQQQDRLTAARFGAFAWRNNVGAVPASEEVTCPQCNFRFTVKRRPIRYGLANDSTDMNKRVKSSDLILAIPRVITPQMVGTTIAQFGAVECKRSGWIYAGTGREPAQQAFHALVLSVGGFATFSTGALKL